VLGSAQAAASDSAQAAACGHAAAHQQLWGSGAEASAPLERTEMCNAFAQPGSLLKGGDRSVLVSQAACAERQQQQQQAHRAPGHPPSLPLRPAASSFTARSPPRHCQSSMDSKPAIACCCVGQQKTRWGLRWPAELAANPLEAAPGGGVQASCHHWHSMRSW
jgi:hypothetical protein